ncbi:hypothetical protein FOQG_15042 [Fusarium oxysporum f. sp. raphani 54005]|uniref:Uncharacterized protein n=1 Tax=Fusarium oxysporum f. sp. raphani 54005 TaxID=1089458 RepID=X0BE73_FUSOX|nr:hypothetical protein FOQG_15042 [Fusarium oxysporum f. sp. raphani 54005]
MAGLWVVYPVTIGIELDFAAHCSGNSLVLPSYANNRRVWARLGGLSDESQRFLNPRIKHGQHEVEDSFRKLDEVRFAGT